MAGTKEPFQPSLEMSYRGHRNTVLVANFQPPYRSSGALSSAASGSRMHPQVVSCGADGSVFLWDAKPTVRALRFIGHSGPVLDVAYSPKALLLASCGHDGYARLWLPSLRRTATTYPGRGYSRTEDQDDANSCAFRAHSGAARALAFAQDGSDHLYTVGDDKSVKCWNLNYVSGGASIGGANRFVGCFSSNEGSAQAHCNWVRCVAVQGPRTSAGYFHYVASGGDDKTIRVWDTRTRRSAHVFYEHTASVRSIGFHPDGFCLTSADASGTINVFDLRQSSSSVPSSGAVHNAVKSTPCSQRYGLLQHYGAAHSSIVHQVSFSPNGAWLLSAGEDGTVKLWDAKEGLLYCTVQAHSGPVKTARFSADGQFFVTGGKDRLVMVWRSGLPHLQSTQLPTTNPISNGKEDPVSASIDASAMRHNSRHRDPASQCGGRLLERASVAPSCFSTTRQLPANMEGDDANDVMSTSQLQKQQSRIGLPPLPTVPSCSARSASIRGGEVSHDERPEGASPLSEKEDSEVMAAPTRSFERTEERCSYFTTHRNNEPPHIGHITSPTTLSSSTSSEGNCGPSASSKPNECRREVSRANGYDSRYPNDKATPANLIDMATEKAEQDQVYLAAQEKVYHALQNSEVSMQRMENLEKAVISLAQRLHEGEVTHKREVDELREKLEQRENGQQEETRALKGMMQTLIAQQEAMMKTISTPYQLPGPSLPSMNPTE